MPLHALPGISGAIKNELTLLALMILVVRGRRLLLFKSLDWGVPQSLIHLLGTIAARSVTHIRYRETCEKNEIVETYSV